MRPDLELFESYARKRAEMGSPLEPDYELSSSYGEDENAIIRKVNADVYAKNNWPIPQGKWERG